MPNEETVAREERARAVDDAREGDEREYLGAAGEAELLAHEHGDDRVGHQQHVGDEVAAREERQEDDLIPGEHGGGHWPSPAGRLMTVRVLK
jgi:hypothetical protein